MNSNSNSSGDNASAADPEAELLKDFQAAIQSYADAINADDQDKADQAAMGAMMIAITDAMKHPTPELELAQDASEQLVAGHWQDAERSYRKLIELHAATGKPGLVTKPFINLSNLFFLLGQLDEALACAQAAIADARRSDLGPLVVMALRNVASCQLSSGALDAALASAEDALRAVDPGKMGDLMRSICYADRARCRVAMGDGLGAESDLASARAILKSKQPSHFGTGPVVALASCSEVQSEILVRQNRFDEAICALKEAIEHRREGVSRVMELTPHPTATLARRLERLAEIQRLNGDESAASASLEEAGNLWREIHLPERAIR